MNTPATATACYKFASRVSPGELPSAPKRQNGFSYTEWAKKNTKEHRNPISFTARKRK